MEGSYMSELDLPMIAFCLNGYGEFIRLFIDEVFGFPEETSYGGGYSAKGRIEIQVKGYKVNSKHNFTTGELFQFKESLKNCYQNIAGCAELQNTERALKLSVSFDKTGKVRVFGEFQERPDINNKLLFEFESDQTCIPQVIKELEVVQKIFGNMTGVKNVL